MKITITGNTGEDKTTIGQLIQNTLSSYGFNVKLTDDGPYINAEVLQQRISSLSTANQRNIIEIETVQNTRQPHKE